MAAKDTPTKASAKTLAPASVGVRIGGSTVALAVCRLGEGFDQRAAVVASDSGDRTSHALVARAANGEWLVGEAAKMQAHKNRGNTFANLL